MKILVISGFLGAGKTTFIQKMTQITGRDFVVYENEYAGTGIDTKRLEENESLSVWESTENCVCCSGKADFASTILVISNTIDPEYLIVEPTGVAKLSNILSNIRKIQYERISLLKPVVIVDVTTYHQGKLLYPDISEDQIRAASVIVFSKTGNALPEETDRIAEEVRKLNPEAAIMTAPYERQDAGWFMKLLQSDLDGSGEKEADPEESADIPPPDSMALLSVSLPTPTHLIAFLNMTVAGEFGRIIRAKGNLPCGGEWIRFDLVGASWTMTGGTPAGQSECAFIGEEIARPGIRRILQEDFLSI